MHNVIRWIDAWKTINYRIKYMLNEVFTPPTEQAGSKTVSNLKNNTSLII